MLCRRFNGAALFQSGERGLILTPAEKVLVLQWGRSFSERRTGIRQVQREMNNASMGPLFFRAENGHPLLIRPEESTLQWGRSFSERRTRLTIAGLSAEPCFNGAALFQSGELRLGLGLGPEVKNAASMGPLFFRAENKTGLCRWGVSQLASMGPLFFRAENVTKTRLLVSLRRLIASMGPLFFRAENVASGRASCGPT